MNGKGFFGQRIARGECEAHWHSNYSNLYRRPGRAKMTMFTPP
jgi:hypothetical protein